MGGFDQALFIVVSFTYIIDHNQSRLIKYATVRTSHTASYLSSEIWLQRIASRVSDARDSARRSPSWART